MGSSEVSRRCVKPSEPETEVNRPPANSRDPSMENWRSWTMASAKPARSCSRRQWWRPERRAWSAEWSRAG